MNRNALPLLRVFGLIVAIALLAFVPTREFLKMTFIIGVPVVLFLALMRRQPKRNVLWVIGVIGLLACSALYIYSLTGLPNRVAVRYAVMEAASLQAEGRYDEAIEQYEHLYSLGKDKKADEEIAKCQLERQARQDLERAMDLLEAGETETAKVLLQNLPEGTRTAIEGNRVLRSIK